MVALYLYLDEITGNICLKPLSKTRFRRLLHSGHGRAALHVHRFGLDGVADIVLDACLHDRAYDPQCEASRAEWLFALFQDTPHHARFATAIVERLAETDHDHDLRQCCELAGILARHGDETAREALKRRVFALIAANPSQWIGLDSLIATMGTEGIILLARQYGRLLRASPDSQPCELSSLNLDPELGCETLLNGLARDDHDIAAYLRYCKARAAAELARQSERPPQPAPDLQTILDALGTKNLANYRFGRIGSCLSDEDVERLAQRLLQEDDETIRFQLLKTFRQRAPAALLPYLLETAVSAPVELRGAAIDVLANFSDPRVGELGRSLIASATFPNEESIGESPLSLLQRNLQASDVALLQATRRKMGRGREALHAFTGQILDIAELNPAADLSELLGWLYEHSPCSICRQLVLKQWTERAELPIEVIAELRFDAKEDIRKWSEEQPVPLGLADQS